MSTHTPKQLADILELHRKWLAGEEGGVQADLTGANLRWANLRDVDLRAANLRDVNLTRANLTGANLSEADLIGAYLTGVYLTRANLTGANLTGANLTGANLSEADLIGAYLTGANLTRANLSGADLRGANLTDVRNMPTLQIVPETGAFEGWKKLFGGCIAHIRIPSDARRVNSTGRKCRAEYVEVLAIYNTAGNPVDEPVFSQRGSDTLYKVGCVVRPDSYNHDFREECTNGIHFFITRKEAEEY